MKHLGEGTLQAWLDMPRSGLQPSEVAEIEGHLESCEACREALAALGSLDDRAEALLVGGLDPAFEAPPFDDVVARAETLATGGDTWTAPRPGRGRGGLPQWRLQRMAWAASIVVAIGVGWMTNEIYRGAPMPELRAPVSQAAEEPAAEAATSAVASSDDATEPGAVADAAPLGRVEPAVEEEERSAAGAPAPTEVREERLPRAGRRGARRRARSCGALRRACGRRCGYGRVRGRRLRRCGPPGARDASTRSPTATRATGPSGGSSASAAGAFRSSVVDVGVRRTPG